MNKQQRIVTVSNKNLFSVRNVFMKARTWFRSIVRRQRSIPRSQDDLREMKLWFWYTSGSLPMRLLDYLLGYEYRKKKGGLESQIILKQKGITGKDKGTMRVTEFFSNLSDHDKYFLLESTCREKEKLLKFCNEDTEEVSQTTRQGYVVKMDKLIQNMRTYFVLHSECIPTVSIGNEVFDEIHIEFWNRCGDLPYRMLDHLLGYEFKKDYGGTVCLKILRRRLRGKDRRKTTVDDFFSNVSDDDRFSFLLKTLRAKQIVKDFVDTNTNEVSRTTRQRYLAKINGLVEDIRMYYEFHTDASF